MRKRRAHLALLILILAVGSPSFAAATDEEEIERTYNEWAQATNEKSLKKWSTFLAPDAYFLPPDSNPLTTEETILDYYRDSFADPAFSLDCQQLEVHVAESGEMAWARGICKATFTNPEGNKATGVSRWFKIWVKQPGGSWKGRVNTWKYVD
jgi:ketosteroid isomerase-like protein